MNNHGHHGPIDRPDEDFDPADSVEAYETDAGTVLYDAGNPLAWIESNVTIPISEIT